MAIAYQIIKDDKTLTLNELDEICCQLSGVPVQKDEYSKLFLAYTAMALHLYDKESEELNQEILILSMIDKAKVLNYNEPAIKLIININAIGYKLIAWRE